MNYFQIELSGSILSKIFVFKNVKKFLNNNDLHIKSSSFTSIETYPKVVLKQSFLIQSGLKFEEAKAMVQKLPEFLEEYNLIHPHKEDLNLTIRDIHSIQDFKESKPIFFKTLVFILGICIFSFVTGQQLSKISAHNVLKTNNTTIYIEEVKTDSEQSQGLSNREFMAENHGMLFTFPEESNINFWMKDMMFPLDFIYLDKNFKVVDTISDQEPCPLKGDCPLIKTKSKFTYVIEVNSGFIEKNEIEIGTQFKKDTSYKLPGFSK